MPDQPRKVTSLEILSFISPGTRNQVIHPFPSLLYPSKVSNIALYISRIHFTSSHHLPPASIFSFSLSPMDYRRQFRFLPWFSAATPARPTSEPPSSYPKSESSTSTQPSTTVPVQRPPFRPPGIAPVQAQAQARVPSPSDARPSTAPRPSPATSTTRPTSPTRAASVPPSPSRRATESRTSAPPAVPQTGLPPLAATEPAGSTRETRAASVPPSPSRRPTEPRTSPPASPARGTTQPQVPQTRSPSRAITEAARPPPETRAPSLPPSPQSGDRDSRPPQAASPATAATQTRAAGSQAVSPSRLATHPKASPVTLSQSQDSKPQATEEETPKLQSPARAAPQPIERKTSQPPSPSRTEVQKEQKAGAVSQPQSLPKQPETAKEESSEPASPKRPLHFQQEPKLAASPEEALDAKLRKEGVSKAQEIPQPPLEEIQPDKAPTAALLKLDEMLKGRVAPHKPVEEEKTKVSDGEEAQQRTSLKLSTTPPDATAKSTELPSSASEAGRVDQQKQEVIGRKETWMTKSDEKKDIKITSAAPPKDNKTQKESRQRHAAGPGEQTPLHKGIREDISSMVQKLATQHTKLPTTEKPVSVVTLAGENRGASMHVGSESAKKDISVHIYRGYKLNPDESPDFTTDAEGSSRGRKHGDSKTEQDSARQASINSNMQGINNSIMLSSSVTERDPGVHLVLYEEEVEAPKSSSKTERQPPETRKDEFNVTRAEKLTYEPTVRRRCLRGLFLESSDSDTENPEKPRRHGCRYSCRGKDKEKEISVL